MITAKGGKTTEFYLQIASMLIIVGLIVATSAFGWKLDSDLKALLMMQIGGTGVYTASRAYLKARVASNSK